MLVFSLFVEHIADIIIICGSLVSTSLMIVFPVLFYLLIEPRKKSYPKVFLFLFLIFFAVACGLTGILNFALEKADINY